MNCPCGSRQEYAQCCKRYHENPKEVSSALALMRARYSAYAMKNSAFLVETTLPQNRVAEDAFF